MVGVNELPTNDLIKGYQARLDHYRNRANYALLRAGNLVNQVRLLNRAIQRKNRTVKRQRERLEKLTKAVVQMRILQRGFAATGSVAMHGLVIEAERIVEELLPAYTAEEKAKRAKAKALADHPQSTTI